MPVPKFDFRNCLNFEARAAEGGVLLVQGADCLKDTEKSSDRGSGWRGGQWQVFKMCSRRIKRWQEESRKMGREWMKVDEVYSEKSFGLLGDLESDWVPVLPGSYRRGSVAIRHKAP